jgi:hypothetical protein
MMTRAAALSDSRSPRGRHRRIGSLLAAFVTAVQILSLAVPGATIAAEANRKRWADEVKEAISGAGRKAEPSGAQGGNADDGARGGVGRTGEESAARGNGRDGNK